MFGSQDEFLGFLSTFYRLVTVSKSHSLEKKYGISWPIHIFLGVTGNLTDSFLKTMYKEWWKDPHKAGSRRKGCGYSQNKLQVAILCCQRQYEDNNNTQYLPSAFKFLLCVHLVWGPSTLHGLSTSPT